MAPLAPHEKLFVDSEFAEDENHGEIGCDECHGGDPNEPDWKKAHEGLVKDPSYPDPSEVCGSCHEEIAENYQTNLHISLAPKKKMIDMRANPDKSVCAKVDAAREGHCKECHSSCGQCHISRPEPAEGGLMEGHLFQKRPPMDQVCTVCHSSRVGNEFLGKNKGIPPDIHKEKYFKCTKCHKADEMHGDGKDCANRYEVKNGPKCLDCHNEIYEAKSENAKNHWIHKDQVSCRVCHSQPYLNCSTCHIGPGTKSDSIDFKIGLNPLKSKDRPEKFVTLRQIPVDHDTFKLFVKNGLTNFDRLPNWKLATPHNIRRQTAQNKTCNACHGNKDLFLLKKDVKRKYLKANKNVIVPKDLIPKKRLDE